MQNLSIITIDKVEFDAAIVVINQKIVVTVAVSEEIGDTEIRYSGDLFSNEA